MQPPLAPGAPTGVTDDEAVEPPEAKRPRTETADDDLMHELHYLLDDSDYGYIMEVNLEFNSNRKMKNFLRAPNAYLARQLHDTDVQEALRPRQEQRS